MRYIALALISLIFIGCGTNIKVFKKTYDPDGNLIGEIEASYHSTKDIAAPAFDMRKDAVDGYSIELKADNANNSEYVKQIVEGMKITLDGMSKLKP